MSEKSEIIVGVHLRLPSAAYIELVRRSKDTGLSYPAIISQLLALPPPPEQRSLLERIEALEAQPKGAPRGGLTKADVERMIEEALAKLQRGY